jgi:hypothetical protein
MIRRLLSALIVSLPAATACTDAFAPRPNTDVGLYVWGEVTPAALSMKDWTTQVRVRVYVRNPSGSDIRVVSGGPPYTFTSDPTKGKGMWGGFRVGCAEKPLSCGPNTDWWGDSVYVFSAGKTSYNETEFTLRSWATGGWPLSVRAYHVRVWFNGREGEGATLNIIP